MNTDIAALYVDCRKDLLSYLTHMLHCPEIAEDIAHESFVIMVSAARQTHIDHPRGFLFRTACNLAIDHVRHNKVVTRHVESEMLLSDELPCGFSVDESAKIESFDLLQKILLQLPSRTRDVLIYHRLHGLSYKEIAEKFNISESAVEKHISRGVQHCRRRLEELDYRPT